MVSVRTMLLYELSAMSLIQKGDDLSRNKFKFCRSLYFYILYFTIDVAFRCIDHSIHRAAYHFIKAFGVPSLTNSKQKLAQKKLDAQETPEVEVGNEDDRGDIDVSLEIDATAIDTEAMLDATVTSFDPGYTLGKLLAFVNQVRMSSEEVCEYLARACVLQDIKPLKLRLWVRTRWGSLSYCLEATLAVQKVS